jgi:hypothetical protein
VRGKHIPRVVEVSVISKTVNVRSDSPVDRHTGPADG